MADYASEQTLQELVAVTKTMSANLLRLGSSLANNSTAGATDTAGSAAKNAAATEAASTSLKNLAAQSSKLLPAMSAVTKGFTLLGSALEGVTWIFGTLGGMITGVFDKLSRAASVLGQFAGAATEGNMKLSQMVDVIGDLVNEIPLVGGVLKGLAGIASMYVKRQEQTLDMFRQLSQVGVGVGQSLDSLRSSARGTGLTMDEYQTAVNKNSRSIAITGGDIGQGIIKFNKNLQSIMGVDGPVSRALFGLGYKAGDAGDLLGLYMSTQGTMNKRGLDDSARVSQGVQGLAEEMTYLSEITGKRREQIADELREATEEANWQAFTSSLSPEEAERASKAVAQGLAVAGKDGAEAVKLAIRTGITTPVGKVGTSLYTSTQGYSQDWLKSISDIRAPLEEYNKNVVISQRRMGIATNKLFEAYGTAGAIMASQGQSVLNASLLANGTRMKAYKSDKEALEADEKLRQQNKNAGASNAAALAQQTQNIRSFGNIIDKLIELMGSPLMGPIMSLTNAFMDAVTKFAKWIQPRLEDFINWLTPWIKKFSNVKSWDDFKNLFSEFWNDTKAKSEKIWQEIKTAMGPLIKDVWESAKPVMYNAITKLFEFLWDAFKTAVIPRWMRSDTKAEKAQEAKKLQDEIDQINAAEKAGKHWGPAGVTHQQQLDFRQRRLAELKGPDEGDGNAAAKKPLSPDQLVNARNWAFSIMTRQDKGLPVPVNLKDEVDRLIAKPDASLKKQVDDFIAAREKKGKQDNAQSTKDSGAENTAAKTAAPEEPKPTPAPAVATTQEPKIDPLTTLNNSMAQLLSANRETAANTKRTADLIAAGGNQLRSM